MSDSAEQTKLRQYVTRKLAAGVLPHAIIAEIARYGVPEARARALVEDELGKLAAPARPSAPPPRPSAPPPRQNLLEGMDRTEIVEFARMQLRQYDPTTVHQQLMSYGYADEEARAILGEAGALTKGVPSGQSTSAALAAKKGEIRSLYTRAPLLSDNARGWLVREQREILSRTFWRCTWMLVVVLVVGAVAFAGGVSMAGGIGGYVIPLNAGGVFWMVGILILPAIAVLGALFLVADLVRHVGDLFPGRIRIVEAYLHSPAAIPSGHQVQYTVSLGASRRRYRLWTAELYQVIGRWGLQNRYSVYYSPRTRWIWHVDPKEADNTAAPA